MALLIYHEPFSWLPDCENPSHITSIWESLEETCVHKCTHIDAFECVCLPQYYSRWKRLNRAQWSFKCEFCPDLGIKESHFTTPASPPPLPVRLSQRRRASLQFSPISSLPPVRVTAVNGDLRGDFVCNANGQASIIVKVTNVVGAALRKASGNVASGNVSKNDCGPGVPLGRKLQPWLHSAWRGWGWGR